ncbi:MAG: CHAT domain-containing protein [Lewinellaceae bacterium]|nr:CHAT domain-containing protein [Lewinellaceae bacterium]
MTITLDLPPDQTAALLQLNERFQRELEQQAFPAAATLSNLKTALAEALDRQPGALKILDDALHRPGTLRLAAADTHLRNLPWHLALEDRPLLSLVKTHRADLPEHRPAVGLPLKVLVMVSAPEGATRLDYEAEELSLLRAFAPLMSRGLAQVHFTDDGSLENLQEKLAENRYHVLHFSGHGAYKDEKGSLLLENAETGKAELVGARDFNEALQKNRRKGHCPDLVVLSACQSAQGGQVGDLQGVADELLAGGVPAVVAMSASILDVCATEFAAALYAGLAQENPLPGAFFDALRHLREFEIARLRRPENAAPGQWLIPQLLVSAGLENLYDKSQKAEELSFTDSKYVRGDDNLLQLRGGVDRKKYRYVFIGRRTERRFALARLRDAERPAVLLRGQGGVGKTALAEHLAVRMLAANPKIKVFTHSERAPTFDSLRKQICQYLEREHDLTDIEFDKKIGIPGRSNSVTCTGV